MSVSRGKSLQDKFISQQSNMVFDRTIAAIHGYSTGYLTGSNNAKYVNKIIDSTNFVIVCGTSECATEANPKEEYCF